MIVTQYIFIIPRKGVLPMFKIIALVLICIIFLFNLFISVKSYLARKREIPEEVKDVYDEERYLKWKAYSTDQLVVKMVISIVSFIISLALIIPDVFSIVAKNIENHYLSTLAVLGVYLGIDLIVGFIGDYVLKIKIEGKYGFNNSTMKTFVGDCIKKALLIIILFVGLTCLFIAIYEAMGDYVLILFSAILFVIVLFVAVISPLLSKVNNRFASLEEGSLRTRLMDLLTKNGYNVRDIKVMDASRRTNKSNAYFSGLGKTKTIVLYDNILKTLDEDEIVATFAHEMGHGLHKDSLKRSLFSLFSIIALVVLTWLLVRFPEIYKDFGFNGVNYGLGVILLFECLIPLVFTLLNIPMQALARHQEFKADETAVKEGYGDQLISGLKKLYKENLGDLNPDPLVVALSYSHPTLYQRIRNVKKIEK